MNIALDLKRRILLLLFTFIICYFIFGVISTMVLSRFGITSTPAMRILAVFQDILLFIIPALLTALILTRQPAKLLALTSPIPFGKLMWGIGVLIASIPAMNLIIWLNEHLPLPEDIAFSMHQMETNAKIMVTSLQGPHTILNLLVAILIVGVFAGFSEELIFRGCLQRLMSTGGLSAHAAIWIAAFVFSLLHMQIYGFVPRMLLGALFGYSLWWTGSLWVPVILHIFNNTVYLIGEYLGSEVNQAQSINSWQEILAVVVSVALTIWLLRVMSRPSEDEKPSFD